MQDDDYIDKEEVVGSLYKYHRITCHTIRRIYGKNYKRLSSWKAAVDLGLEPCGNCRPYYPHGTTSESSADTLGADVSDEDTRTKVTIAELGEKRRALIRLLNFVDQETHRRSDESVAARIGRLSRDNVIPRQLAACMRTITEMRNVAEYERTLTSTENSVVASAWGVIKEWAKEEHGLNLLE